MKKRMVSVILVLCMILCMLPGCTFNITLGGAGGSSISAGDRSDDDAGGKWNDRDTDDDSDAWEDIDDDDIGIENDIADNIGSNSNSSDIGSNSDNPNGGVEEGSYYPDLYDESVPDPDLSTFTTVFALDGLFIFTPDFIVEEQQTPTTVSASGDGIQILMQSFQKSDGYDSAEAACTNTANGISAAVEELGGEILLNGGKGMHKDPVSAYVLYYFQMPIGSVVAFYEVGDRIIQVTVTFENIETQYKMAREIALSGNY